MKIDQKEKHAVLAVWITIRNKPLKSAISTRSTRLTFYARACADKLHLYCLNQSGKTCWKRKIFREDRAAIFFPSFIWWLIRFNSGILSFTSALGFSVNVIIMVGRWLIGYIWHSDGGISDLSGWIQRFVINGPS